MLLISSLETTKICALINAILTPPPYTHFYGLDDVGGGLTEGGAPIVRDLITSEDTVQLNKSPTFF